MPKTPVNLRDVLETTLSRPIAYHSIFGKICGSAVAGLFLAQSWYWSQKTADGWFWKTKEEWEYETCLGRYEQQSARATLRRLGFLLEAKRGTPMKLWFCVHTDAVYRAIVAYIELHPNMLKTNLLQTNKLETNKLKTSEQTCEKTASKVGENQRDKRSKMMAKMTTESGAPPVEKSERASAEERRCWDLRRWQIEMRKLDPPVGTYIPDKRAAYIQQARQAAFNAGLTIPRLQEILRGHCPGDPIIDELELTQPLFAREGA